MTNDATITPGTNSVAESDSSTIDTMITPGTNSMAENDSLTNDANSVAKNDSSMPRSPAAAMTRT